MSDFSEILGDSAREREIERESLWRDACLEKDAAREALRVQCNELVAECRALKSEVRKLLAMMSTLDPTAHPTRHPDWPLQLRGDDDAAQALCDCLNRLHELNQ